MHKVAIIRTQWSHFSFGSEVFIGLLGPTLTAPQQFDAMELK